MRDKGFSIEAKMLIPSHSKGEIRFIVTEELVGLFGSVY